MVLDVSQSARPAAAPRGVPGARVTPAGHGALAGATGDGRREVSAVMGAVVDGDCTSEAAGAVAGVVGGPPRTLRLTEAGWLPDASDVLPAALAASVATRCAWTYEDGRAGGVTRLPSTIASAEAEEAASAAQLVGAAFVPFASGGVGLTYLRIEIDLFVGSDVARGGGGLWLCYSDLVPEQLSAVVQKVRARATISPATSLTIPPCLSPDLPPIMSPHIYRRPSSR